MSGMGTFTPALAAYRFYDDDGNQGASTPLGTGQDTALTIDVTADETIQIRLRIQETGGASGGTTDDYRIVCTSSIGGAFVVGTITDRVRAASAGLTGGGDTTQRLTNGTGSFVTGEQCINGLVTDRQLTASNFTEHVWGATLRAADLVDGETLTFQANLNGSNITSTITPTINVTQGASEREASGSPQAQAADGTGTIDAVVSATGAPQAGAATSDGSLQHRTSAVGAPQADAATADGTATVRAQLSGSPQAGAAVASGAASAPASLSGSPQAGAAAGDGAAEVLLQLSGTPQADAALGDGTISGDSTNLAGSPQAGAADGAGSLDAIVSASGAPQAGAALGDGLMQFVNRLSGAPQADAAAAAGTALAVVSAAGTPQAAVATAAGTLLALASLSGAPTAGAAASTGEVGVVVSMSGSPQAGFASGGGFADDGQAPLIVARPFGKIVDVGEILR